MCVIVLRKNHFPGKLAKVHRSVPQPLIFPEKDTADQQQSQLDFFFANKKRPTD